MPTCPKDSAASLSVQYWYNTYPRAVGSGSGGFSCGVPGWLGDQASLLGGGPLRSQRLWRRSAQCNRASVIFVKIEALFRLPVANNGTEDCGGLNDEARARGKQQRRASFWSMLHIAPP
ncbi:hypothetical protein CCM_05771 [Cordyceps militaris CM01]|uniref:Uncharacterized protein n=1 Tax=Cordyceps militaris (strain CM01) TaxID=983644 RepID=G3JH57_CORMM|nr:uncharacterized protein CCM_05771 [Cordyceps militaris CM01]EGX91613.1 hypothetical protein CCM_05771 [Cordyceps militaris CM01]